MVNSKYKLSKYREFQYQQKCISHFVKWQLSWEVKWRNHIHILDFTHFYLEVVESARTFKIPIKNAICPYGGYIIRRDWKSRTIKLYVLPTMPQESSRWYTFQSINNKHFEKSRWSDIRELRLGRRIWNCQVLTNKFTSKEIDKYFGKMPHISID